MKKLRVGMAQILVEGGLPKANLDRAVQHIVKAATQGCHLVVLPECMDLGWTHCSATTLAKPIPGEYTQCLADVAKQQGLYVVAGLVERDAEKRYNAAVLIDPAGEIQLHHRKINLLDVEQPLYEIGDRLSVVQTPWGVWGVNICADNFESSLAIGHVLARMGAQLILAPSAWAVGADFDHEKTPYEEGWHGNYAQLCRLYDIIMIGVSNVGRFTNGRDPWQGGQVIGRSLAVGPNGEILKMGPYGQNAEALTMVDIDLKPPRAKGVYLAACLEKRGYQGH